MFRIVELEDCEIKQYVFLTDAESVESQLDDIYDALKDKLGSSFTVVVDTLLRGNLALDCFVEIELIDGDNEIFNLLKKAGKKSLIIFSSVLHEYNWENFKPFFILFDTIVMRDMQSPEKFWYKVPESTRALVTKDFPGELLAKLERKYGYINDLERLYNYFLMYRYADNFDHELQEDYFSIIWENLKEWLTYDYVFHVLYEKDYILPFIKQDIETKFGYELKYPTHKQIIFVKD